jgi:hypothetical protein
VEGLVEIDLSGYITYRVYVVLEDPEDCVQAVFGGRSYPMIPFGDCVPDSMDMCLIAPCGTFSHPIGTGFFSSTSCLFGDNYPSLYFDSFVTIGSYCDENGIAVMNIPQACDTLFDDTYLEEDCDVFEGGNFYMDSNAFYTRDWYSGRR